MKLTESSPLYWSTFFNAFPSLMMATVWIEILFPNPMPLPSDKEDDQQFS